MFFARVTLAVVALLAYVGRRGYRPSAVTYGRILKEGSEYFVLFQRAPTSRGDALSFCGDRNDGKLPQLRDNGLIRQNAVHRLLQLHGRTRDAYVWTDDACLPDECPPLNSSSWLFNNFETHQPVPDGDGYLAIGQYSNRLRKLLLDSTLVSVIVCVYDLSALRSKCDDGSIDDVYFDCLDTGFVPSK